MPPALYCVKTGEKYETKDGIKYKKHKWKNEPLKNVEDES